MTKQKQQRPETQALMKDAIEPGETVDFLREVARILRSGEFGEDNDAVTIAAIERVVARRPGA